MKEYNIGDEVRAKAGGWRGIITFKSGMYYFVSSAGLGKFFIAEELQAVRKPSQDVKNQ